jgi:hypothetical protein
MIPPRSLDEREQQVILASAMAGLVLDRRHPVAFEIAGSPATKQFLIRATTPEALEHTVAQLRTRYPQASFTPLVGTDDPFHLEAHEAVSVVELHSVAPELPLRTLDERDVYRVTKDPILGLLGALDNLDEGTRAVAQLALVPAPDNWSSAYARKGIEHALQPERDARMTKLRTGGTVSTTSAIVAVVGALTLLLIQTLNVPLPVWILRDVALMVQGKIAAIPSTELTHLFIGAACLGVGAVIAFIVIDQLRYRLGRKRLYDQRLVAQKIQGPAYRVRLRVYVISPGKHPGQLRFSLAWLRQLLRLALDSKAAVQQTIRAYRKQRMTSGTGLPRQPLFRQLLRQLGKLLLACIISLWFDLGQWRFITWQEITWRRAQARRRRTILAQFLAAYRQYHLAQGDYFRPSYPSRHRASRYVSGTWGKGVATSTSLLSAEAIASLWHPPAPTMLPELALVESRAIRTALIPPALAHQPGIKIGLSEQGGYQMPVPLAPEVLQLHGFVAGQSGEGKSTFFVHLARAAMTRNAGLLVVDPHGDMAEDVLRAVPPERVDDVVFIDLADKDHAFGLNPIDVTLKRDRDKLISDLLKTFALLWASSWGPRMENAFRVALQTLYEANQTLVARDPQNGPAAQYSLLDVLPLFTRQSFRHALLQDVHDKRIHQWWTFYFEPLNIFKQQDITTPILNKTTEFAGPRTARIIGQGCCTLDFKHLIEEQRIIILKLAQGTVGDIAPLIGTTLLGLLQTTLEEQGQLRQDQRKRLLIFIDEFQALPGMDFQALAQLRKYGATFVLATQSLEYLDRLDRKIVPVVLANVKQITSFRLSAWDAQLIAKEMELEETALKNLPAHACYARWTSQEVRQPAFSFVLDQPPPGDLTQAETMKGKAATKYTKLAPLVDLDLEAAVKRAEYLRPANAAVFTTPEDMADAQAQAGQSDQTATTANQPPERKHGDRGRKAEQQRGKQGKQPKTGGAGAKPRGGLSAMDDLVAVASMDTDDEQSY